MIKKPTSLKNKVYVNLLNKLNYNQFAISKKILMNLLIINHY